MIIRVHSAPSSASPGALPTGFIQSEALHFFPVGKDFAALFAVPLEQAEGPIEVRARLPNGEELSAHAEAQKGEFRDSELKVAQKFIAPSPEDQDRMAEDKKALADAYAAPFSPLLFTRPFRWPRPKVITAPFGDRRMFNGSLQSQHYGTDLEGKVGQRVVAANSGRVVLARSCFASGNTVVLHHGADLFTAYFHLSQMRVKPGQTVQRGQLLGRVGKTGRVTGPHLHWAAKVGERYVNPESLFQLQ